MTYDDVLDSGGTYQGLVGRPFTRGFVGTVIAQGASVVKSSTQFLDSHPSTTASQVQYNTIDVELTAGSELNGATHSVGIYSAVEQVATGPIKIYGMNAVVVIDSGIAGQAIGLEVDVNNNGTGTNNVDGIVVNGSSATAPNHGLWILAASTAWTYGLKIQNSSTYLLWLEANGQAGAKLIYGTDTSLNYAFSVAQRGTIGTRQSGAKIALAQGVTTKAIGWAVNEPDTNYEVYITPSWNTTVFATAKLVSGFTANFGTATPDANQSIDVVLIRGDAN